MDETKNITRKKKNKKVNTSNNNISFIIRLIVIIISLIVIWKGGRRRSRRRKMKRRKRRRERKKKKNDDEEEGRRGGWGRWKIEEEEDKKKKEGNIYASKNKCSILPAEKRENTTKNTFRSFLFIGGIEIHNFVPSGSTVLPVMVTVQCCIKPLIAQRLIYPYSSLEMVYRYKLI